MLQNVKFYVLVSYMAFI